ncbi:MAG TPA: PTS sugar transporter subunit IIA [Candidatus Ratteibacteria bacterium]|nr:PTS sugar transporter subunit IIA [bacterium]HRR95985.1 PTS sugar transporter subunit IIA [Candidatus Ratteibacteria bacterium]
MKITDFLDKRCVIIGMRSRTKKEAIKELLTKLKENGFIKDEKEILETVMEREKLGSTGIGQGIAVPHAKSDQIENLVAALGISKTGIDFNSLDGEQVNIVFLVLAPTKSVGLHLKALAKIARLLKDRVFRNALKDAQSPEEIIDLIKEDEQKLNNVG